MLKSKFKIFGDQSIYFDPEEMDYCKNILQSLCDHAGIELLGFQSMDYAIAFHHGPPDCSLPLFYMNNENWNYLFKNKKTEIDE
jgi:hypothetical protein